MNPVHLPGSSAGAAQPCARHRLDLRVRRGQGERERPAVAAGAQRIGRVDELPEGDARRSRCSSDRSRLDLASSTRSGCASENVPLVRSAGIGEGERGVARAARDRGVGGRRVVTRDARREGAERPRRPEGQRQRGRHGAADGPGRLGRGRGVDRLLQQRDDGLRRAQDGVARGGVALEGPGRRRRRGRRSPCTCRPPCRTSRPPRGWPSAGGRRSGCARCTRRRGRGCPCTRPGHA